MFCSQCGHDVPSGSRFCPQCGAPVQGSAEDAASGDANHAGYAQVPGQHGGSVPSPPRVSGKRLVRPRSGRMIAGVCAAFAQAYGWDVTVVRLLLVAITLVTALAVGVLAYTIAWIMIPEEPQVPLQNGRY